MSKVAPLMMPENTIDEIIDGCKATTVKCKRTDNQICDVITVQAQSAEGLYAVEQRADASEVSRGFGCPAQGYFTVYE
ncbi:hypothetical protein B9Z55_017935 [Caenorhabditis nigoni]|nr:hypothetical protein B9Z55_017935 [Caenorhabditis nigoni]